MRKGDTKRKMITRVAEHLTDVTLDDCANNPRKINIRKTKVDINAIGRPIECEEHPADELEEDGIESLPCMQKATTSKLRDNRVSGATYPPDIWFLIARYIPAPDLCRFALICKDAYKVLLSVQFWKQLCRQLNSEDPLLPRSLRYPCDRKLGLRSRVIRLLFLRCPTLAQRIQPPVSPRYEPYTLAGMRLSLAWHEKEGNHWNFWFKWISYPTGQEPKHRHSELYDNPESDCRVLKATCPEFICFPYPQFCYLSSISLSLTSDMRGQKLSLGFSDYTTTHSSAKMKQCLGRNSVVQNRIDLEPVIRCVLMDWWHPEYPHPRENINPIAPACLTEDW